MKHVLVQLGFGIAFGFVFSRGGFSDWRELSGMFRLESFDPAIAFATVLLVTAPLWVWLDRFASRRLVRPIHPGSVPGGILFGLGWAAAGACPALALVQLGEGKGLAFLTLGGIVIGNYAYALTHARYLRWPPVSCVDD